MSHHRLRTVVVTGASSGIGRATALEFAARGYALTLTARRREVLEEVATQCRSRGAQVMAVPADVTDAAAMEDLARRTVSAYGRLDVWVNNAGVAAYGRTEEMPDPMWRRVVQTNLFGAYHGARAALPWLREQGSGVLINVASVFGKAPAPLQSSYVASKYAVRALTESLRQETADAPGVSVCAVLPGAVDTPLFRVAGNTSGYALTPPTPAVDARRVAAAIVRCAQRPRRQVPVGVVGRGGLLGARLAPRLTEKLLGRMVARTQFSTQPAARTEGNLFQPTTSTATIDGGWRDRNGAPQHRRGLGRTVAVGAGAVAMAAAATGLARAMGVRGR